MLFLVVRFGSTTFTPRLNLFRDDLVLRNLGIEVVDGADHTPLATAAPPPHRRPIERRLAAVWT
jgi:hypothetical protein